MYIMCVCSLSMHDGFAGKTRSSSDDSHEYSAGKGRHCQGCKQPRKELKYNRVWMILVARSAWLAPTRSTLDPKLV